MLSLEKDVVLDTLFVLIFAQKSKNARKLVQILRANR